jgi:hypothetical protein
MLPTLADQSAGTGFLGAETGPQAGLLSVPKTGHKEEGYLMRFYWARPSCHWPPAKNEEEFFAAS